MPSAVLIYGIKPDGEMRWYRHDGWANGNFDWTAGDGGKRVGTGWNTYATILPGVDNLVYGIKPDGEMRWYRHDGWANGSFNWTAGDGGKLVGTGWNMYHTVFAMNEFFYGIKPDGEMRWYRHDGWADGSFNWTAGDGGKLVGTGWNTYHTVITVGNLFYGIKPNGEMRWYRHNGWADGSSDWTAGDGGKLVGTGWNAYRTVFGAFRRDVIG